MRSDVSPFGWLGVIRIGFVQMALGAIIILTTSTLNRVIVVELALPAVLPGLLVGWHYAVQITRPRWGYGADKGGRRTPWILGGMVMLAAGAVLAAMSALLMQSSVYTGIFVAFIAFSLIGFGVGAAGTNLLALLAIRTPPERKAAAAAIVWIMMILGFVVTAGTVGQVLDPFTMQKLVTVTLAVGLIAVSLAVLALFRIENQNTVQAVDHLASRVAAQMAAESPQAPKNFRLALNEVWQDPQARLFTMFVFVAMLAYSAQDLILEPFAGLVHGYTPGESTKLAAVQKMGVLLGMIVIAVVGTVFGKSRAGFMRLWTVYGCLASAAALAVLSFGALAGQGFPLRPAVFALGVANGTFAVAAIGSMMTLASAGPKAREGTRMGVWGAAQAIAFGIGGLAGAAAIDVARGMIGHTATSFALVFSIEATVFVIAAFLAIKVGVSAADHRKLPMIPVAEV
ncbi:MAG: BCD family MFS transporter [Pseudomonadota bacterium]